MRDGGRPAFNRGGRGGGGGSFARGGGGRRFARGGGQAARGGGGGGAMDGGERAAAAAAVEQNNNNNSEDTTKRAPLPTRRIRRIGECWVLLFYAMYDAIVIYHNFKSAHVNRQLVVRRTRTMRK